mmetsp:Transcript_10643/g.29490  ORF Transcript_10643/g.29490 Transcript_10643/m.29490 type:complete len:167 (-) Transcript_10643:89-589(-)
MSFGFEGTSPEQDIDVNPSVGDVELQHWIDTTRENAERAVIAARAADMAKHIADVASKMAITSSGKILFDKQAAPPVPEPAAPELTPATSPKVASSAVALAVAGIGELAVGLPLGYRSSSGTCCQPAVTGTVSRRCRDAADRRGAVAGSRGRLAPQRAYPRNGGFL